MEQQPRLQPPSFEAAFPTSVLTCGKPSQLRLLTGEEEEEVERDGEGGRGRG